MLILNNNVVASAENLVRISSQDFANLSQAEKDNGDIYFIYDADDYNAVAARNASKLIGTGTIVSGGMSRTLVGAINDLYTRLGGMRFSYNSTTHQVEQTYDPPAASEVITAQNTDTMTDEELITYLNSFIGSTATLASMGYNSVAEGIADLLDRLGGVRFVHNVNTGMTDAVQA